MNNNESEPVNMKQEPQISIELNAGEVRLPLSTFNNILEREVTNYVLKQEKATIDIDLNELIHTQSWKLKYDDLEKQAKTLQSIIHRLKKDLEKDKFAQPARCIVSSVGTHVISLPKLVKVNDHKSSNKEPLILTLSDSEDDLIKNVSIQKIKINDTDHVLKINTEASQTLSYGECSFTSLQKPKPQLKSKFVDNTIPIIPKNMEINEKKMRLNECEIISNKKSSTKKMLNYNSFKELKVPWKFNHNFLLKPSNLEYPPPYPYIPPHNNQPSWKRVPPIPTMTIKTQGNKITLNWDLNLTPQTAKIKKYELFVCQETNAPPDISMWKKNGSIVADVLPMTCELEMFDLGYTYHFALRAVDVHNRRAPFVLNKIKI